MYIWVDDIEDAYEMLDNESAYEICDEIARKYLIEEEGWDEDADGFDDAVAEEADYIGLYRIRIGGALYSLLRQWYEQQGKDMTKEVRGYYEDYYGDYMYYVTGCGYDTISADLLGGSADGQARREFEEFVRSKNI